MMGIPRDNKRRMDGDNIIEFSCLDSYPAVRSSMAGGKETLRVLPLTLVHTQVSRYVPETGEKHRAHISHFTQDI